MIESKSLASLPFPKQIGLKHTKDYTLPFNLHLFPDTRVPAGTTVKLTTTNNFGFLILPEGFNRRIFKF